MHWQHTWLFCESFTQTQQRWEFGWEASVAHWTQVTFSFVSRQNIFLQEQHPSWTVWIGELALDVIFILKGISPLSLQHICVWSTRLLCSTLIQFSQPHKCHVILIFRSWQSSLGHRFLFWLHWVEKSLQLHHMWSIHCFYSQPCLSSSSLAWGIPSGQEAIWLLVCSASFLSTSGCSLVFVVSLSALTRTLSRAFSFSRFSEVSASSCSRLTASPSCRLFSRCCFSKLFLSCCSSTFWAVMACVSNFSRRLSRQSCANCWERCSRALRSVWTSFWSARNSAWKTAPGPERSASLEAVTGLSA